MILDLSTIPARAREGYIRIGRRFSSTDTAAQGNQTLKALTKHPTELIRHGFGPEDAQQLADACETLEAESVGRGEERGTKKVASHALLDAIKQGRVERDGARSILSNATRALLETGGDDAEEAVRSIQATLQQTARSPGSSAPRLAEQLVMLRARLLDPVVIPVVATRGGPEAVADMEKSITTLRAAEKEHAGMPGTRTATERLDLLDGLVVTLARSARKAARAAARRLGTPALAAEFELTCLYERGSVATTPPAPPSTHALEA